MISYYVGWKSFKTQVYIFHMLSIQFRLQTGHVAAQCTALHLQLLYCNLPQDRFYPRPTYKDLIFCFICSIESPLTQHSMD